MVEDASVRIVVHGTHLGPSHRMIFVVTANSWFRIAGCSDALISSLDSTWVSADSTLDGVCTAAARVTREAEWRRPERTTRELAFWTNDRRELHRTVQVYEDMMLDTIDSTLRISASF
jgi:hypothetical protein